jgi:hypothetical protein
METVSLRKVTHCRAAIAFLLTVACAAFSVAAAADNPHWKAGTCNVCHDSDAPTADNLALKTTPGFAVCSDCHDGLDAEVCRHRSDISVTPERLAGFDEAIQAGVTDNSVACTTCHEMKPHCALDVKQRYRNPSFLRGTPFDSRSEQCFACHERSTYRQPSPHRQGRGTKFKENLCIFCHEVVPELDADGQWKPVHFATDEPLSKLCSGCHNVGPHPSSSVTGKTGWFHMSVPDQEFNERMGQTVATLGGNLPLDPNTGEMTCATCHNPHDPRLAGFPAAETPGEDTRLRYDDICGACHEK